MIGEFSREFLNFARTVDIVDKQIWTKAMQAFEQFLQANKIVRSAGYLIRDHRNLGQGPDWCLHSIWWAKGKGFKGDVFSQYLKDLDAGHTNFSYMTKKAIWVVSKSKKPLHEETDYLDLLGNEDKIPPFKLHPNKKPYAYTSICYPNKLGVLNLELKDYVTNDHGWEEAVERLANGVHYLYRAYMFRDRAKVNSLKMLDSLQEFAKVPPHTYFISYAHENSDVADHVEVTLRRKTRNVKRDAHDVRAGDVITERIMRKISESDTFIGLWGEHYAESKYCMGELRYASEKKLNNRLPYRIILLKLDDCDPANTSLGSNLHLPGQDRPAVESSMSRIIEKEDEERISTED